MPEPLYKDYSRTEWIRDTARRGDLAKDSHLGLWYNKFFHRYERRSTTLETEWKVPTEAKVSWINTVTGTRGESVLLDDACERQRNLVRALGGRSNVFSTDWHFVAGLGLPHPVENGFSWHPTLGLPYFPATSIKGLLRAWVEIWSSWEQEVVQTRLRQWFGDADQAGSFVFFDAIPTKPVRLILDVMTPHRGKWYAEGDQIQNVDAEPDRIPADWHSPIPVPFLVVEKGSFLVSVAPRDPRQADSEELESVFGALTCALDELGAGAKTAVGYGRWLPSKDNETT